MKIKYILLSVFLTQISASDIDYNAMPNDQLIQNKIRESGRMVDTIFSEFQEISTDMARDSMNLILDEVSYRERRNEFLFEQYKYFKQKGNISPELKNMFFDVKDSVIIQHLDIFLSTCTEALACICIPLIKNIKLIDSHALTPTACFETLFHSRFRYLHERYNRLINQDKSETKIFPTTALDDLNTSSLKKFIINESLRGFNLTDQILKKIFPFININELSDPLKENLNNFNSLIHYFCSDSQPMHQEDQMCRDEYAKTYYPNFYKTIVIRDCKTDEQIKKSGHIHDLKNFIDEYQQSLKLNDKMISVTSDNVNGFNRNQFRNLNKVADKLHKKYQLKPTTNKITHQELVDKIKKLQAQKLIEEQLKIEQEALRIEQAKQRYHSNNKFLSNTLNNDSNNLSFIEDQSSNKDTDKSIIKTKVKTKGLADLSKAQENVSQLNIKPLQISDDILDLTQKIHMSKFKLFMNFWSKPSFSYDDFKSMFLALGGQIDESTGSSHIVLSYTHPFKGLIKTGTWRPHGSIDSYGKRTLSYLRDYFKLCDLTGVYVKYIND